MNQNHVSRAGWLLSLVATAFHASTAAAQCVSSQELLVAGTLSSEVRALASYDDGSGPALYAIGDQLCRTTDLLTWQTVSMPVVNASSAAVFGGELVVGGDLSAGTSVQAWNGTSWHALAGLGTGTVKKLVPFNGKLYAIGGFTLAGGDATAGFAVWDGASWSALNITGGVAVSDLCVHGSTLAAVGAFTTIDGVSAFGVGLFDGTNWTAPPNSGAALRLCTSAGGLLYATGPGGFTNTQLQARSWNGTSWQTLPLLPGGLLYTAIGQYAGVVQIAAAGQSSSSPSYVIRFTGSSWTDYGTASGVSFSQPTALLEYAGQLIVGGRFKIVSGVAASYVARWNGSTWFPLGIENLGSVNVLTPFGSNLIAGGSFSELNGVAAANIGQFNGVGFSPLGVGVNGTVASLRADGGSLYVGGRFSMAGGSSARNLAVWNGSTWSSIGSGAEDGVTVTSGTANVASIEVIGPRLYVGGTFTKAGSLTNVGNIAYWDGAWHSMTGGVDGSVRGIREFNGDLIVVGAFSHAGGFSTPGVARWNGSVWSAFGAAETFYALEVHAGELFAGAYNAVGVRRWDGTQWIHDSPSQAPGFVKDLHSDGTNLFASDATGFVWRRTAGGVWQQIGTAVTVDIGTNSGGLAGITTWMGSVYSAGFNTDPPGAPSPTRGDITRFSISDNPPAIQTQPVDTSVNNGFSTSLSVVPTGPSLPVSYQWFKDDAPISGLARPSALTANLEFVPAVTGDAGDYYVVITNACGSVTSDTVTLTVNLPCTGDINGDFQVNLTDLSLLLSSFGLCTGSPGFNAAADINETGCVDLTDLSLLLGAFGIACP